MRPDPVIDRLRRANPVEVRPLDGAPRLLSNIIASPGDPRLSGATRGRRQRRWIPSIGTVVATFSVAIALTVAVMALTVLRHHRAGSNHAAVARSVKIVATAPDPHGGLPWGLREVHTRRGQTCLQVGRLKGGLIGVLGQDGAWANDHGFHAIAPSSSGLGGNLSCGEPDRNGNAFINISDSGAIANAYGDATIDGSAHGAAARVKRCPRSSSDGRGEATLPPPCPKADLRDLEYGLLGPDATSITYVGAHGRRYTQRTSGPDGAYLIVRPQAASPCLVKRSGGTPMCGEGSIGPLLQAGIITAVTYRNGRVCHLPAPTPRRIVKPASCPLVGYQSPPFNHVTEAEVAAPISARALPAKHYCNGTGHNFAGCKQVVLTIAFTARVAVTSPNSYYEAIVDMPRRDYTPGGRTGCPGSGSALRTQDNLRAGQRVHWRDDEGSSPKDCAGNSIHITIAYVPNAYLGLNGMGSKPWPSPGRGSIVVGKTSLALP
jgi:hypothetical protein